MPDIYGSHFELGGVSSRTHGLIIATESSDRMEGLYGEITSQTIFNKKGKRIYLIGDDYSESPLKFEVEIFSDDFEPILPQERRTVEKWLFKTNAFRKLYLDTSDDENFEAHEFADGNVLKRLYLNCRLINPSKIYNGAGVVGYKATLETDSGMFWQDPITKVINSGDIVNNTFTITTDTDIDGYIYPKVTIVKSSSSGNIEIANTTDNASRKTKFTSVPASTSIVMRSDVNMITGATYSMFTKRNFIRLLDGTNTFSITGSINRITFEYQNRRTF